MKIDTGVTATIAVIVMIAVIGMIGVIVTTDTIVTTGGVVTEEEITGIVERETTGEGTVMIVGLVKTEVTMVGAAVVESVRLLLGRTLVILIGRPPLQRGEEIDLKRTGMLPPLALKDPS